jgi:hypothetical protein
MVLLLMLFAIVAATALTRKLNISLKPNSRKRMPQSISVPATRRTVLLAGAISP